MEMDSSVSLEPTAVAQQVLDEIGRRRPTRVATYRLQLHHQFTFFDAAKIVPYLRDLGVSHVYCAPYLRARSHSMHGYDICDHNQINPELGGEEGYKTFTEALRTHGMGQILDIVANHVAASLENPLWLDVLENGRLSPYGHFFDIDWQPIKHELAGKVLLPVLGRQYGEALEEGELRVELRDGAFFVIYYEHAFPLAVKSTIPLLSHRLDELRAALGEDNPELTELESIITAGEHLPSWSENLETDAEALRAAVRELQREKEIIKRRLRELVQSSSAISEYVQKAIDEYNGDRLRPESFDLLDRLLRVQAYRVCQWRAAADEINYRRFFDINDLAAICMESPDVFYQAHALVRSQLAEFAIEGLRIDHVDGLFDPEQYLYRLQWAYLADLAERLARGAFAMRWQPPSESEVSDGAAAALQSAMPSLDEPAAWRDFAAQVVRIASRRLGLRQPTDDDLRAVLFPDFSWSPPPSTNEAFELSNARPAPPLYVLVEKILGPDEPLPESWPVAGTSGYDFMNLLNGLMIHPGGLTEITKNYQKFRKTPIDLSQVEYESKLLILRVAMSSELQMLAHRLNRISEQHRRSRDLTLNMLRLAVREVLACFPVYRIDPGRDGVSDRDRRFVNVAVSRARKRNPAFEPSVFEFLRNVLLLEHPSGLSPEQIAVRELFAGKFQQVTSPVMAKGVEDTAFYVYTPLLSANEVGSHPARPATSVAEFHEENRQRQKRWPTAMLATSTHDTKRSEDVRARLNVLTEAPRAWRDAATRFRRVMLRHLKEIEGEAAPSRNDEYLYYQSLLGVWPSEDSDAGDDNPSDDAGEANYRQPLVERLQLYMEKATHEAKQRTSWVNPHPEYDQAVREFVATSLREGAANKLLPALLSLFAKIAPCGQYNALFQTALKILSPGVADIYQGQELWDYSLVDPDNRRPVDYDLRRRLLAEIRSWESWPAEERIERIESLRRRPFDPRLKLLVTHRLLALRRDLADVFARGEYVPLDTSGPRADRLVAFAWLDAEKKTRVIVAVPRLVLDLLAGDGENAAAVYGREAWGNTYVSVSRTPVTTQCAFTRRRVTLEFPQLDVGELLHRFPLMVLRVEE
jgi:(1->4)-alpha-D-glucan 1-alpha-D-glucosylmutase